MFGDLNLSQDIQKALEKHGYVTPTEIQQKCIPLILEGKDVVGKSVTGSGKTFAFALPAIERIDRADECVQVLIVCPTRELCLQVTDEVRKVTEETEGIKTVPIYGGANMDRQITALKTAKIVVGTPGRLMDHLRRRTLKLDGLRLAVLDEADEMLNMGFREDIETILKQTKKTRQTVMFSATMPPAIKAITKEYMREPVYVEIGAQNATINEIEQTYLMFYGLEKRFAIVELMKRLQPRCSIVFCNTKRMVDVLYDILTESGFDCVALHGDMRQPERKRVMTAIKEHRSACLVATDVAARGIDIEDVDYIFNFDFPLDMEYYIHRIGRTGRAGKSGKAISLIGGQDDIILLSAIQTATKADIKMHELSDELEVYVAERMKDKSAYENLRRSTRRKTENGRRDEPRSDSSAPRRDGNNNRRRNDNNRGYGDNRRDGGNRDNRGSREPRGNEEKRETRGNTDNRNPERTEGNRENRRNGENRNYRGNRENGGRDNRQDNRGSSDNRSSGNREARGRDNRRDNRGNGENKPGNTRENKPTQENQ